MKKTALLLSGLLACLSPAIPAGVMAAAPKTEKEVPVFPGAVHDVEEERASREYAKETEEGGMKQQTAGSVAPLTRSSSTQVFKASAAPEDVFRFYVEKLQAKNDNGESRWKENLKRGETTDVWYTLTPHSPEMKGFLSATRKPHQKDTWVSEVRFYWQYGERNGDSTTFDLEITDETLRGRSYTAIPRGSDWKGIPPNTKIVLTRTTAVPPEAAEKEREAQQERADDERHAALMIFLKKNPPTEKTLGVPVYPRSRFDAEMTAGMSQGPQDMMYVFFTDDPPPAVLGFYEKATGKKGTSFEKDKHMIPLKGGMPMPEHGISIETLKGNPLFQGKGSTVITIRKAAE